MFPPPPRCLKNGNDTLRLILAPRVSTCKQNGRGKKGKYMFIGCVSSQLSVANFTLSIVSVIVSGIAIWVSYATHKRYASGIIDVALTVLNPVVFEKIAKTLSKTSPDNCPGNQNLNLFMTDEYGEVWQAFFNLNILSELMLDNVFPKKINTWARNSIKKYLSRNQVQRFVKANKTDLQALCKVVGLKD